MTARSEDILVIPGIGKFTWWPALQCVDFTLHGHRAPGATIGLTPAQNENRWEVLRRCARVIDREWKYDATVPTVRERKAARHA